MTETILAEDHVLVRQALRLLLKQFGINVIAEASNGQQAIELVEKLRPPIALLDLSMPILNGIDAAREIIRVTDRQTKVILLTVYNEPSCVLAALSAGVAGYVLKSRASSDLIDAIREVTNGNTYLSSGVTRAVVDTLRSDPDSEEPLSVRERQVLQLVAEGMSTKEIASTLSISIKTGQSHRSRIMKKLNIHDTAGLVLYAIREGLIQP